MAEEEKQGQHSLEDGTEGAPGEGQGEALTQETPPDEQDLATQEQGLEGQGTEEETPPPDPEELIENLVVEDVEEPETEDKETPPASEDQEEPEASEEGDLPEETPPPEDLPPEDQGPPLEPTEEPPDQPPEEGPLEQGTPEDIQGGDEEVPPETEEGLSEETEGEGAEAPPPDDLLASLLDEAEEEEALSETDQPEDQDKDKEKDEDEAPRSKVFWGLFALGLLVILGLLAAGGVVLWHLWHAPLAPPPPPKPKVSQTPKPKAEPPLVVAPIVPERKLLILDNFLIPYQRETGEYVFVKAKALLYFANDRDFVKVQKDLTLWREQVYQVLKNIPLYVWENRKGEEVVRKQLLSYLKKVRPDGIIPVDLEVTGYILK